MADCIGVTTEHVNRMLRALRDEGTARMEDGDLIVHDEAALRERAGFDAEYLGND